MSPVWGRLMQWPRGDLVEVEWIDSASTNGWRPENDWQQEQNEEGLVVCRSAGYMIGKDKQAIRLVQSQSKHGATAEQIAIPRSCVRAIRKLSR